MSIYKIPTGRVPEAPRAANYLAGNGVLFFDETGVLRLGDGHTVGGRIINSGGSGNGSISVNAESSSTRIISTTIANVTSLNFDTDSGFSVSDLGNGAVLVGMNSTFKYWKVNGVLELTAQGLDTVNFIAGTGTNIVGNAVGSNSLTFGINPATANSLGGIKVGNNLSINTDGVLNAAIGNIDGGVPNSVYGGLVAIDGGGI